MTKTPAGRAGFISKSGKCRCSPDWLRARRFSPYIIRSAIRGDTAHEFLSDAGVVLLPSRHGPVATRGWESIREGIQDADLARVAKEKLDPNMKVEEQNKMLQFGTTEELLKASGALP